MFRKLRRAIRALRSALFAESQKKAGPLVIGRAEEIRSDPPPPR
jgi:hypothetical protein